MIQKDRFILHIMTFCISSLLFSKNCTSQIITPPTWTGNLAEYKTAKVKTLDFKTNKVLADQYKDATVSVLTENGEGSIININIPDKYYFENGKVTRTQFDQVGREQWLTYSLLSGKKVSTVLFHFDHDEIKDITIAAADIAASKQIKYFSFKLYEFK